MSKTAREVVLKVSVEQGKDFEPPKGIKEATKDLQEFGKAADAAEKELEELNEEQAGLQGGLESLIDGSLKGAEAMKTAGAGAFTFGRGLALVTAGGNSEELAKMMETIARFQGAFDIFNGLTDILKGTSEWMLTLTKSTQVASAANTAATATNTALSVSNTAVGTSSLFAAAGMKALQIASGPMGIVIAAAAAALVAFLPMLMDTGDEANKTAESIDLLGNKLELVAGRVKVQDWAIAAAEFGDFNEKVLVLTDAIAEQEAAVQKWGHVMRKDLVEEALANGDRYMNLVRQLRTLDKEHHDARMGELKEAQSAEQAKQRAIEQTIKTKESEIATQEKAAQAAQKAIDTQLIGLGKLTDAQLAELEAIGKRVAAGEELSRTEEERLRQFSGIEPVGDFLAQRDQKRGQDRRGVLDAFGGIDTTDRDQAVAAGGVAEAELKKAQDELKKSKESQKNTAKAMEDVATALRESNEQTAEKLQQMATLMKEYQTRLNQIEERQG